MSANRPAVLLGVLTVAWAVIAAPALLTQWSRSGDLESRFSGKALRERASFVDSPAFQLAETLGRGVPEDGCVTVLAYAGAEAIDYYSARLDYLLYPRRVQVVADSSAKHDSCSHLAVFRDSNANLAVAPFAGNWDAEALEERLAALENVSSDALLRLYRAR